MFILNISAGAPLIFMCSGTAVHEIESSRRITAYGGGSGDPEYDHRTNEALQSDMESSRFGTIIRIV
jgi:hypothetical protein